MFILALKSSVDKKKNESGQYSFILYDSDMAIHNKKTSPQSHIACD